MRTLLHPHQCLQSGESAAAFCYSVFAAAVAINHFPLPLSPLLINNQLGTTELEIIGRTEIVIFGSATVGGDTFVTQMRGLSV
jgi:hypothetical protein